VISKFFIKSLSIYSHNTIIHQIKQNELNLIGDIKILYKNHCPYIHTILPTASEYSSSSSGILLFQQQVNGSHHLAGGSRRRRTAATAARHP